MLSLFANWETTGDICSSSGNDERSSSPTFPQHPQYPYHPYTAGLSLMSFRQEKSILLFFALSNNGHQSAMVAKHSLSLSLHFSLYIVPRLGNSEPVLLFFCLSISYYLLFLLLIREERDGIGTGRERREREMERRGLMFTSDGACEKSFYHTLLKINTRKCNCRRKSSNIKTFNR